MYLTKCHHPRAEKVKAICINPLNYTYCNDFVGHKMVSHRETMLTVSLDTCIKFIRDAFALPDSESGFEIMILSHRFI